MMRRLFVCFALLVALAGCGTTPAEEAKLTHERQEYEHQKQVESEGHEVEGVLKKRKAEESANAVEEASRLPAK
jgi:hypothetical protein